MTTFPHHYAKLNPSQKLAVDTTEGPVSVIAGPGTGKTQVLAMRIANILEKTQINPSNILALTFTDSGVNAMKKRLAKVIGNTAYFVPIHTFHSFCNQIIKEYPDKFINLRFAANEENGEFNLTDLSSLSELERIQIVESIVDKIELKNLRPVKSPYFFIRDILKNIKNLKREGISPDDFEEILKNEEFTLQHEPKINEKSGKPIAMYLQKEKELIKNKELFEIYKLYQSEISKKAKFDFEDMIMFVIKILKEDSELLAFLQERYQYLLVDEYQDTNNAQNELVFLLMSYFDNPNIFVVGDDDQSIYRFQGANLQNFLFLHTKYPDLKHIVLTENYRSSQNILNSAKMLITNNQDRLSNVLPNINKDLTASGIFQNEESKVNIVMSQEENTEKFFIISEIQKLQKQGVPLSEIAVLSRKNSDVDQLEDIFSRTSIPYQIDGGSNILKDKEIKKIIKLIRFISAPTEDNLLTFEVLLFDFLNLNQEEVFEIINSDLSKIKNFLEIIKTETNTEIKPLTLFEETNETKNVLPKTTEKFIEIKNFLKKILKWQKDCVNLTLSEFFETLIKESGFLDFITAKENNVELLIRLNSLFDFIKEINRSKHEITLKDFLKDLDIMDKYYLTLYEKTFYHKNDAVHLMTAHKSKGLEFEYVFLYKCIDGTWGNNKVRELIKLPRLINRTQSSELRTQKEIEKTELCKLSSEFYFEDERRLFFVAMTRAKKGLYLTYSEKYENNGSVNLTIPSIFINEIEQICIKPDISEIENKLEQRLMINFQKENTESYDKKIQDFAQDKLEKFTLSVTALNAYLYCPRKFFYNNLLKIPRAKPSHMAFGTSVHKALELFFKEFQDKNTLPEINYLLEKFVEALEKEVLKEDEKQRWKKKGIEILTLYFENYKDTFIKPVFLEKFLKTYIDDIAISGKIDKMEYLDPLKRIVKVIDYKTGSTHTRNDIEGKTESSTGDLKRQMLFYKLLADLTPGFLFDVRDCEFDFIEPEKNGKFRKESFEIQKEDTDELKILIQTTMVKIRNLEFFKTDDLSKCSRCEFKSICGR